MKKEVQRCKAKTPESALKLKYWLDELSEKVDRLINHTQVAKSQIAVNEYSNQRWQCLPLGSCRAVNSLNGVKVGLIMLTQCTAIVAWLRSLRRYGW